MWKKSISKDLFPSVNNKKSRKKQRVCWRNEKNVLIFLFFIFYYNKFSRCFLHNFVFQPRLVVSIYYCNVHTVIYESAALFCKYTRTSMVSLYLPSAKTMMSRIDVFHWSCVQFPFKLKNTSFLMLLWI